MSNQEKSKSQKNFWDEMGVSPLTVAQARRAVKIAFDAGLFPALVGHAGIGKTQCLREEGEEDRGGGYVGLYLQTCMPEDIQGLAFRREDGTAYDYLMRSELADLPKKYPKGGVIVLEELNRASTETAAAAFAMMDTFRKDFGDKWCLALAMNPSGGEYATSSLTNDPALRRRVVWIAVREDRTEWLKYAEQRELHSIVIQYIQANGEMLLDTKRREAGLVYATPASWEKVSDVLKSQTDKDGSININSLEPIVSGLIGDVPSDEFLRFMENNQILIHPSEVIENYAKKKSKVRKRCLEAIEQGRLDILSSLCDNVTATLRSSLPTPNSDLANNLVQFLKDLPNELRVVIFQGICSTEGRDERRWTNQLQLFLKQSKGYQPVLLEILGSLESVQSSLVDDAAKGQ